jgi:hypothetical protein
MYQGRAVLFRDISRGAQSRFCQGRLAEATSDGSASRPYLQWRLLFQNPICARASIVSFGCVAAAAPNHFLPCPHKKPFFKLN